MRTVRRAVAWVGWTCKRRTLTYSLIDQEAPAGNRRGFFTCVMFPSDLCVRFVLYSIRQLSMIRLAWAIVTNQCSFRHSSRNLPLKLSMQAFSFGLPGRMNDSCTPAS